MPIVNDTFDRRAARTRQNKDRDIFQEKRKPRFQRWIERTIRRILYKLLSIAFRNKSLAKKIHQSELRSLLVIPYGDAIGDLLLATPIWRAVKRRIPNCKIGVFTSERNESLLRADPDVDAQYHFEGRLDFKNFRNLRKAKRNKYQVVLNLHFVHQTDYGFIANYLSRKGIKITGDHPRRNLYSVFFNYIGNRPRHTTHLSYYSLELLSEVVDFGPPLSLSEAWPRLAIPEDALSAVEAALDGIRDLIVIHQQAATPFREWGVANSIALAKLLRAKYPSLIVVLTASPSMQSALERAVVGEGTWLRVYPSSGDLLEFAALISRARLIISPETSALHFASATQTPVVALLPDRERVPIEWLPVSTSSRLLAPPVRGEAVATIPVADVFDASVSLLDGTWDQTQTSFDPMGLQSEMLQSSSGMKPLSKFAGENAS